MNLVTGATGHLGNVLIRELLLSGEKVRALILPGENCESLEGLDIERVSGDVLKPETLERAMLGVEVVYHLAGIISIAPGREELMWKVNVDGVRNVAKMALKAGVKRMVQVSSIHAFRREPHGTIIDENTPLALDSPLGCYDRTKAEGTRVVLDLVNNGLDAVIVCPTGIIGPHDYLGSHMGQVILDFSKRRPHFLIEGAFDFVDVRDVAKGLILAKEKGRKGEIYILSGTQISIEELKKLVQNIAGVSSLGVIVPKKLALFFVNLAQAFTRKSKTKPRYTSYSLQTISDNSLFSCHKAKKELGYTTRNIKITISDTLEWFKTYRRLTPTALKKLKKVNQI